MVENGDGSKPIWITEFGWYANATPGAPVPPGGVTVQEQADYTQRYIEELDAGYPYVTNVMVYNGTDSQGTAPDEEIRGSAHVQLAAEAVYSALVSMYT